MGNGEESPLVAWKHKGRANFSYEGSTYMIFKLWSKKGMLKTQTYFLPIDSFSKPDSNLSVGVDLAQHHTNLKFVYFVRHWTNLS